MPKGTEHAGDHPHVTKQHQPDEVLHQRAGPEWKQHQQPQQPLPTLRLARQPVGHRVAKQQAQQGGVERDREGGRQDPRIDTDAEGARIGRERERAGVGVLEAERAAARCMAGAGTPAGKQVPAASATRAGPNASVAPSLHCERSDGAISRPLWTNRMPRRYDPRDDRVLFTLATLAAQLSSQSLKRSTILAAVQCPPVRPSPPGLSGSRVTSPGSWRAPA